MTDFGNGGDKDNDADITVHGEKGEIELCQITVPSSQCS